MSDERPAGPLPDVLARLASGMPRGTYPRVHSARARVLGIVLMGATAALVLVAAITAAQP